MIIGIVGFAGSGKGTVADILCEEHNFTKISFADSLKDAVSSIFMWERHLLEGDTEESRAFREKKDYFWSDVFGYEVTPRLMLQKFGTEAGRDQIHQDIWVRSIERRINHMMVNEFKDHFVIPDVRFPNEMKSIRDMGGSIVRIIRGSLPVWYNTALEHNTKGVFKMYEDYPDVHVSEWSWIGENAEYQIDNNHDLNMLKADVSHMLKVLTGPKKSDITRAA